MPAATAEKIFAANGPLELLLPENSKGIGNVILKTNSSDLIDDVMVESFPIWPDDRGYFIEIGRLGSGLIGDFPPDSTQVSAALSYPGTIKAFHYHLHQTDYWVVSKGMFQVALVDFRRGSRTFGARNTLYVGTLRPWQIRIPPGVGHGYKVVGEDSGMLVYVTNRLYNPQDEGRIVYDHPGINYDWELQHK